LKGIVSSVTRRSFQLKAKVAGQLNASPAVREHIKTSIVRLKGGNAAGSNFNGTGALQESRSYRIARPEGVSGWGTFGLQLNTQGVIASQQMSGDEKLATIAKEINAMKFPELVPSGSAAHLLRSAVVSTYEERLRCSPGPQ
jgi:hypothetical protein